MTDTTNELGEIMGQQVYGELDYRGQGRVWLADGDDTGQGTLPIAQLFGFSGVLYLMAWGLMKEGPTVLFVVGSVLLALALLPLLIWGLTGRSPYHRMLWTVGPRRGLFRISLQTAFLRMSKRIVRDQRRAAAEAAQELKAKQYVDAVRAAIEQVALPDGERET